MEIQQFDILKFWGISSLIECKFKSTKIVYPNTHCTHVIDSTNAVNQFLHLENEQLGLTNLIIISLSTKLPIISCLVVVN